MADRDFDPDQLLVAPPPAGAQMTIRPRKLDRDDLEKLVRKINPDITRQAVQAEVDNIQRESGGKSDVPGDYESGHATSGGLYQHHKERLDNLKSFSAKHNMDWTDPEAQITFARHEKETNFPSLLKAQQTGTDRGVLEDQFKRVFEKPASIMWQNRPDGSPVLGNYSDFALNEHRNRPGTDILAMTPWEYLDLTPPLEGKPFESPAGRSLMRSAEKGEPIESLPTLDVAVDGPTATVTDQDGRHRALLAQQRGEEAIPVAVRRTGKGDPKEIVGMNGNLQAMDFPPLPQGKQTGMQPEQPKEPISLMGRIAESVIPSARAAEVNPYAAMVRPEQRPAENPYATMVEGAESSPDRPAGETPDLKPSEIPSWLLAAGKGAAAGLGEGVLGGAELVGMGQKALGAVGVPGMSAIGGAITDAARGGVNQLEGAIAGDRAASPTATGVGQFLGGMVMPGGVASKLVGRGVNALRAGAATGALAGVLNPEGSDEGYWGAKALEAGLGAGAGVAGQKIGNALARIANPSVRDAAAKLLNEGVEMTPGQLAGGKAKSLEDKLVSMPFLGGQIKDAVQRSFETFNRAAINRGLKEIGEELPKGVNAGRDAIGFAEDKFGDAYKQVIPRMSGQLDNPMKQDLLDVLNKAANVRFPDKYQQELQDVLRMEIVDPIQQAGGTLNGTEAQMMGTRLDRLIKNWRNSDDPYRNRMWPLLKDADAALDRMMARNNPVLQAAKTKIDRGYAQFKVVQKASNYAAGGDGLGTFSPYQLNRAAKFSDNSKDDRLFARGGALLQDLAEAAQQVLPFRVPNSGTADRAAMMALLTRPHMILPGALVAATAGAAAYSAPASKAINAGMNWLASMPGGSTQRAIGNALRQFVGPGLAAGGGSQAIPIAQSLPLVGNMIPQTGMSRQQ